ncbi:hypothetical protein [Curtobacterium sp. MCBD17_028]|uniref:hypothetical protein n=1 Tax=Curtobacterium sp. MCBD17_028 TaxID=2175670 RepID=UPI000DAA1169|nr:hypothetical protein [Curtobacterium sp. MCBD17_028]PZE23573.1 hypothetical protein DEI86_14365 [Curtobacterium sp. MCBD17_028]
MHDEVMVLGATGRTGRAIAAELHARGVPVVLAARDRARLEEVRDAVSAVASERPGSAARSPRMVVGGFSDLLAAIGRERPGVVVNTVGPFTRTALPVVRALPHGTHYLDLSNEYAAVDDVLRQDRRAAAAGQVLVPGAGFGVVAVESVVVRLCDGEPRPRRVRVDAIASVATEAGTLGSALAESIADVAAFGGAQVQDGRLVRTRRVVTDYRTITTPDGDRVGTGSGASGELLAAWLASDADDVVAASALAPANPAVRAVLPLATALFRIAPVRRFVVGRLSAIRFEDRPRPRASSWGHARVEWPDGRVREGWLRLGDASVFTTAAAVEVATRLLQGEGRPGAATPGVVFGADLAVAAGGVVVDAPA